MTPLRNEIMKYFQNLSEEEYVKVKKRIMSLSDSIPGGRLLDIGCDDGTFTKRLGEEIVAGKLYGIEVYSPSIKKAKKRGIDVRNTDANKRFPFKKGFFDAIVCNQVAEHLTYPDNLFMEIHRTLKKGGYAIISTPNLASLHNRLFLLFGCQPMTIAPSTKYVFGNPARGMKSMMYGPFRHLTAFTYKSLKEMSEHYGFAIEKYEGFGFYPFKGFLSNAFSRLLPTMAVYSIVKLRKG